jgi:hypothetical protein
MSGMRNVVVFQRHWGRESPGSQWSGPLVQHPSRIAVKDGREFKGVPFSLELGTESAMVTPRMVRLEEITFIN